MTETVLDRRVTIRDVATLAGVSTAAASKVLRNAYGVSDSMRRRVQAAIDELGYRPNATARGMRGRTFTIGVMLSDVHNPFFGVVLDGLGPRLSAGGYELLIGPAGATPHSQQRILDALVDRGMDGLILIAPVVTRDQLEALGRHTPTVVLGRHGLGRHYDTVSSDDDLGSALIVDHLVALGHSRILHLTNRHEAFDEPQTPEQVRADGYRNAMRRHGLEHRIDVRESTWTDAGGRDVGRQILGMTERPTAVHAGADVAALGLLGRLWEAGIQVPSEIAVVGYDNLTNGALPMIGLSTVDQSGHAMGDRAAELLLQRLRGRTEPLAEVIAPTLVQRRSSGPHLS